MKFKIIPNEQTPRVFPSNLPVCNKEDYNDLILHKKLLEKYFSFCMRQKNCVGLAANQVSCDGERIMLPFFAVKFNKTWDIILNPRIVQYSGEEQLKEEMCLTWIGKTLIVKRFPNISVVYYNMKGEKITKAISGFEAQIWQHEYNHLLGIEEEFKGD